MADPACGATASQQTCSPPPRNPLGCCYPNIQGNHAEQSLGAPSQLPTDSDGWWLCPTLVKFHFIALGEKKQE